jgi:hypothetical protein
MLKLIEAKSSINIAGEVHGSAGLQSLLRIDVVRKGLESKSDN